MNNNIKSATTAGLLGIFLGTVGAHNWYLGEKQKGIKHVILFGAGMLCMVISGLIIPSVVSFWTLYKIGWLLALLNIAGWIAILASEVWGFVEGVQILTAGDAGLARRGYAVAQPFNQNIGMNQNQYNSQPYGQTNNQPNNVNSVSGGVSPNSNVENNRG